MRVGGTGEGTCGGGNGGGLVEGVAGHLSAPRFDGIATDEVSAYLSRVRRGAAFLRSGQALVGRDRAADRRCE
jgi:hypothetical protein